MADLSWLILGASGEALSQKGASSQGLSELISHTGKEGSRGGRMSLTGHVHSARENFATVEERDQGIVGSQVSYCPNNTDT